MKKIVVLCSFIFCLQQISSAQGDIRFGFQVSPNFSWMQTDDSKINNNGTNLGLKLGILGEFYFRENYAFIGGIGFAFNHGGTLLSDDPNKNFWPNSEIPPEIDPTQAGVSWKYNLQYVEIPVGLKLRTREFGYWRYFAEMPVFTIGIKSQARGTISVQGVEQDKIDIKDEVSSLALSWSAGGGAEYSLSGSTALMAGIFYQRIFTDITKDVANDDSKGVSNNITLRIGVMF